MDEWGVYDPQQAGLAALYARLDRPTNKLQPATVPRPTTIPHSSGRRCATPSSLSTFLGQNIGCLRCLGGLRYLGCLRC